MRHWTKEETEYLENNWGVISIPGIAKKLNRTINSIRLKANKMGLGNFVNQGDYVTFNQLISVIGYKGAYSYLEKRLRKLHFPIKTKKVVNQRIKIVYLDEFWEWSEKNKQSINFANFEKNSLGLEPAWVNEKREIDRKNSSKLNHNRKWTKADDNLLITLTKSYKYTYEDLKNRLNRTENAIKRRLYTLKVPYRPVPRNNHTKWTEEENRQLVELYNKGYDSNAISQILNKSQLSISDRLKKVN
ncbi:hypothetical protein KQI77_02340 [Clostridium sp. MSJ-8]|uniref:hypothetical protein n=1 Tax=Clostridium sp. MSJ-8 TaxID=2841510 RepID=UPI001C0EC6C7|nr:hypothetical protein [Clostridium sp. MSJ-8]MBU5487003.1 hypothetical protein [Clostridium sp. MSJ-8]